MAAQYLAPPSIFNTDVISTLFLEVTSDVIFESAKGLY